MNDPALPLAAETQALADAYAALNRNDIAGFVRCFDPHIERIEPPGFPLAGTYHGLEAVKAHIAQGRGTWAEGGCEPVRFIAAGDRVVAICRIRVRLKNASEWIDGQLADVYTFRNGKAIEYRTFGESRDALAFAGVSASEAEVPR